MSTPDPASPRRLPPLNALRVFEVAARHMSFTRAADELCVTTAAVSHQIKQLETFLEVPLFERRSNQLQITRAGENYLPRIREAFRAIQHATNLLYEDRNAVLNVVVPSILATKWLIPRLHRYMSHHQGVRVEILTEQDAASHPFDLRIDDRRYNGADMQVERLLESRMQPVCAPGVAQGITSVNDLATQTLLHDRDPHQGGHHPGWHQWLSEAGLPHDPRQPSLGFPNHAMLLQAAMDGQGVALSHDILVRYDIGAGRLVRPLDVETSLGLFYYLIYPKVQADNPVNRSFRDWLQEEASRVA